MARAGDMLHGAVTGTTPSPRKPRAACFLDETMKPRPAGPVQQSAPTRPALADRRETTTTVFLLLSLGLVLLVFVPLWKPLLLGVVFGAMVSGTHEWVARHLWHRRYLSATVLTLGAGVLILTPLTALAIEAAKQAVDALAIVRTALEQGGLRGVVRALPDSIESWIRPIVPRTVDALPTGSAAAGWAAGQLQNALGAFSQFTFDLAIMMIAFFFVLADGKRFVGWVTQVSPLGPARTVELLAECRTVARSVIGSNVLTGLAQAAVATVGYLVAQAPKPLFFGLATLVASFIPSVGTAIVSLPLAAILYLMGRPWAALFLALWSLFIVAVIDNLLRPLLIKSEMHIHGAFIFFSLIGGLLLFGFSGLVIGPLSLGLFMSLVRFHARDISQTARRPSPPPA
jgi:predicted PurR-regulated permease PerM